MQLDSILPICHTKKIPLFIDCTMPQLPKPFSLLLCLLLSLSGMAQVQAAVGMAWTGVQSKHAFEHTAHANDHSAALMNMSCCDEDSEHDTQAAPCTSSHLCCTLVGLLQNTPLPSPKGVKPAPPIASSLQPLPLALHAFWRPPRA